jgi:large exoprotein involved in heme utilization and adhesion
LRDKAVISKLILKTIFGIEPRSERTSESDITASSDLGVDGVVEINRPEAEPSSGLVNLPTELVDVSRLIAQGCAAGGGNVARESSQFVATGRGGLPPTLQKLLEVTLYWQI